MIETIDGANDQSYVLTDDDVGFIVSPLVTVIDAFGNEEVPGYSSGAKVDSGTATGLPKITGDTSQGSVLSGDLTEINDPDGFGEDLLYKW